MSVMPQLRIADLLANTPIDPEAHLDAAQVKRYAEMLDALPPLVVFDTGEALLLADGYHRLAAARRCGLEMVKLRCAMARSKMRCNTLRRWPLHSAASPPTRSSRASGNVARTVDLRALSTAAHLL